MQTRWVMVWLATLDEGSAVFRSRDGGWVQVSMPRAEWETADRPTQLQLTINGAPEGTDQ